MPVMCQDAACNAEPESSLPVVYHQMSQTPIVITQDRAVEASTDSVCHARPMPRAWFCDLHVNYQHLAQEAVQISQEYRMSPVNHLADRLTAALNLFNVFQCHTVQLMGDFAFELLRISAQHLLEALATGKRCSYINSSSIYWMI